jgi:hypothetical protein
VDPPVFPSAYLRAHDFSLFFLCTFLQAHTSFSDSLPYSVLQTPDRERSRVYPTGREEREPKFRLARPFIPVLSQPAAAIRDAVLSGSSWL